MHQAFFFFSQSQGAIWAAVWAMGSVWTLKGSSGQFWSFIQLLFTLQEMCSVLTPCRGRRYRMVEKSSAWNWVRSAVGVCSLQWGASVWVAKTSVKEVTCGVCASSMGHPAPSQVVQETTVWTQHVLGPAVYVVFSKGPILRKAHHRRRTRSCFLALAGSLPFFPPWVWHLGSPAAVWRPLSWGGWALMTVISAFYLPSEGRLKLAILRLTHHSEPSLEVCARRTSLLTHLTWLSPEGEIGPYLILKIRPFLCVYICGQ